MKLKFFDIPAEHSEAAEAELNRFLVSHRVSRVEKAFVSEAQGSFWSVVVTWVDGTDVKGASSEDASARAKGVDYREVLSGSEFSVFDRLRRVRKELALAEGLPPYAVFSNEQLAQFVQQRVVTEIALAAVPGVGEARLARYGEQVLQVLRESVAALGPAAGSGSVSEQPR